MKKPVLIGLIIFLASGVMACGLYYFYFPKMVAKALVADDLPVYVPKRIQNKIDEFRLPVNKSLEDIIREVHRANIPMDKILRVIDDTAEEDAYRLLDELNQPGIKNTHQVFDIVKKYFPADFDSEVFRKPFTENVDIRMIRKGIKYANMNRKTKDVDIETVRAIIRQLLIEKEKEFQERNSKFKVSSSKFQVPR